MLLIMGGGGCGFLLFGALICRMLFGRGPEEEETPATGGDKTMKTDP